MTKKMQEVEVYDNSEIENFCKCERKHYFRHIRNWAPDRPNKNLAFGSSWHKGMDSMWSDICWNENYDKIDVVGNAMAAFIEEWTGEGFPDIEEWSELDSEEQKKLNPQSPITAFEMFYCYFEERLDWLKGIKLINIESPVMVPLDPNDPTLMYGGRLDKEYQRDGRIYGVDHKTTSLYSKIGYFRDIYIQAFNPNRQLDGYFHYLRMKHGKKAKAVWADCALVHRDVHDGFRFIPVEMQTEHMELWLWETHYRIQDIRMNKEALAAARSEGNNKTAVMPAFPRKTEACTLYNKPCEYMDLCQMWANPELYGLPEGFKEEAWSPFEDEQLEKLGLKLKEV